MCLSWALKPPQEDFECRFGRGFGRNWEFWFGAAIFHGGCSGTIQQRLSAPSCFCSLTHRICNHRLSVLTFTSPFPFGNFCLLRAVDWRDARRLLRSTSFVPYCRSSEIGEIRHLIQSVLPRGHFPTRTLTFSSLWAPLGARGGLNSLR